MPDKKDAAASGPSQDEALAKRIDDMMDPEKSASAPKPEESAGPADSLPPLDIFHGQPAAPSDDTFGDSETDKAVDDIAAKEGDAVLAAEDAATNDNTKQPPAQGWKAKLRAILRNKWTWVGVAAVLLVLFGLPVTRYKILGLFIKKPISIIVTDSKTNTPVSAAVVSADGRSVKTDADGKAQLKLPLGKATLTISKQYYQTSTSSKFVGFGHSATSTIHLVATGRQVPITVLNTISGQPVSGANIQVLKTTAKTSSKGQAVVVLPASASSDPATVSLSGYNTANATIQVTSSVVKANSFNLTPAGHVYFLSNQSGTIDVVKTNLDGSDRHTVLTGTGKEDPQTTNLLSSRDWRYAVLEARRNTAQPALYLIDTSTDKVTEFDSGDNSLTLIGWYGHNFAYDETHNATSNWQSGREVIKAYDADHLQLNQLDQNQAEGSATAYAYQNFSNFYILNGVVAYNTTWFDFDTTGNYDISGKTDTIRTVQPNGQGKKDYQSFPAPNVGSIQTALYGPQSVYYAVFTINDNKTTYYSYNNQSVNAVSNIDQTDFNQSYPTYLFSPSGNQTFWTESRDGQNALFVGDPNAKNSKQVASLNGYSPYGWFTDSYIMVSKNSSQLYILPASGLSSGRQPLKISDYYKPPTIFRGYGYGYGGL